METQIQDLKITRLTKMIRVSLQKIGRLILEPLERLKESSQPLITLLQQRAMFQDPVAILRNHSSRKNTLKKL